MVGFVRRLVASARLRMGALFVRHRNWIDAHLLAHEVAMRHRGPVLDRGAPVLFIVRGVGRDRCSDRGECRHGRYNVTSRLARGSVVLLMFANANRRETI